MAIMQDEALPLSMRPYLLRAIYEWCSEHGCTPYVAVQVDASVQVPREYVHDGKIVLNISMDATSGLKLGDEFIEFKARFGGKPRDIMVPIGRVLAIYARENGQGMAFSVLKSEEAVADSTADSKNTDGEPSPLPPTGSGRPALKRIK